MIGFLFALGLPALAAAQVVSTSTAQVASTPSITVHYPGENASIGAVKGSYILGNVQPPAARLRINGQEVSLFTNGGFLAFLPVSPGTFTFRCEAALSTATVVLERRVLAARPMLASPSDVKVLEEEYTLPKSEVELRPGDWLQVQVKATAGMKGTFDIRGLRRDLPLVEQTTAGLYLGAAQIQPGDKAEAAEIRFTLRGGPGKIKATAPGRLSVLRESPRVAYAWPEKSEAVVARTGPGTGYMLFLATGTRVLVDARMGAEVRLRLSDSETGWAAASQLRFLPPGTPAPHAVLSTLSTHASTEGAHVRLALNDKVPYFIEQAEPALLRVKLYTTTAHTNWILYDPQDRLVSELRWRQEATRVAVVEIRLRQPLWGYRAAFESGGLRIELRAPPPLALRPASPLKDRLVVLDPGHSLSDPGRIAPLGSTERELNLKTALVLKDLLEKEGAKVLLTRETNDAEVPLQERVHLAAASRADAFLSLHNNALPDGTNPFDSPHGFSFFYYHPLSLPLARHLHQAYQKSIPLADEGLRYGDLMVARMTFMPAVLAESAYFIFPEQEAMLNDPAFQERLGGALLSGLKDFFEEERTRAQGPQLQGPKKPPSSQAGPAKAPKPPKLKEPIGPEPGRPVHKAPATRGNKPQEKSHADTRTGSPRI